MSQEKLVQKSDKKLKLFDFLCWGLFLLMVVAALAQVSFRFVFKISVPWTEELARIFYIWIIFLGMILIEAEDNQIKTTFLIHKLPYKLRFALQIVINVFSIFFELCLFIGAIKMFGQAKTMNFGTMPFLSTSILYVPVIISCPFVVWYLFRQLVNYSGGKDDSDGMDEILEESKTE